MKTKKTKENTPNLSSLTYEEYYHTLMLAKKIRIENESLLKEASSPKDKTKLLEILFTQYQIPGASSLSPKEREIATLLKINIFIPDSKEFAHDYKNKYDKNIRLISEAYQIPAPFAISKVAEIGKYEQFLEQLEKEGGLKSPEIEKSPVEEKPKPKKEETLEIKETKKIASNLEEPKKEPTITTNSSTIKEELLRHTEAIENYYMTLFASNDALSKENTDLKQKIQELQDLITKLEKENKTLAQNPTKETVTESNLRKKVKELEFTNSELAASLQEQQKNVTVYRNRAIVAEARLDQLRDSMLGIAKQVDTIEFESLEELENPKKK